MCIAAQTDLAMLCSSSNSATCTFKSELTSDDGSYWHQNGHAHHQNGHASQTQLSNSALPLICRPGLVHRASQDSRHNGGQCTDIILYENSPHT